MGHHVPRRNAPPSLVQRLSHEAAEAAVLVFPSLLSFIALYRRLTTWHLGLPVSSEIEKLRRVTHLCFFIFSPSHPHNQPKNVNLLTFFFAFSLLGLLVIMSSGQPVLWLT
jgi:hypothetical protein